MKQIFIKDNYFLCPICNVSVQLIYFYLKVKDTFYFTAEYLSVGQTKVGRLIYVKVETPDVHMSWNNMIIII